MHLGAQWLMALPGLPLVGSAILLLLGRRLGRLGAGVLASAMVGLAFLLSLGVLASVLADPSAPLEQDLYTWVGALGARVALRADALSGLMAVMVTGVGLLVHVYSLGYMDDPDDEPSCWRYFSALNGFVAAMLLLVLASDLFLLFVGWEGVGFCSWLLIGFWFSNEAFAAAGRKAFLVNRVGDFFFVLGLVLLYNVTGGAGGLAFSTLQTTLAAQPELLSGGLATLVVLLFFGGAVGKSAQIPLYVWLPDAMAGPTPVSALIHAATMVTAGVYLLLRLHFLLVLSPVAMGVIALVGAVTAVWAALLALAPGDVKKVLAYSTISQLGFMFMAVGVGAWVAGFFHLLTHAFFKSLLFLGAGAVIKALHHQQDLAQMGALRRRMRLTFFTFGAGTLAIMGIPGTAGFFSKDEILWRVFSADPGQAQLWGGGGLLPRVVWSLGVLATLLTAFYMTRLFLRMFYGHFRGERVPGEVREVGPSMAVPLVVLAALALAGGALDLPHWLAQHGGFLTRSLAPVFAGSPVAFSSGGDLEYSLMVLLSVGVLGSATLAWFLVLHHPSLGEGLLVRLAGVRRFLLDGGAVDAFYGAAVVRPLRRLAAGGLRQVEERGVLAGGDGLARLALALSNGNRRFLQRGRLSAYLLAVAFAVSALVFWATVR